MIESRVLFIIDEKGDYINQGSGSVKALSDLTNTIHLIAPFPINNMIMFNTLAKTDRMYNDTALMFATSLKGADLSDNPNVKDWNVWQVKLTAKQLSHISKYATGSVKVSFSIREKHFDLKDGVYKGIFNDKVKLPQSADKGDYYMASDYSVKGYQRGDIAQFNGSWNRVKVGRLVLNTEPISLPILATLHTNFEGYEVEAEDIINDINGDINEIIKDNEVIKNDINVLKENKLDKATNQSDERQYYAKDRSGIQVMIDESDLKPDLSDFYNKGEVDTALRLKANVVDIPYKVSQLINDKGYVTKQEVEDGVDLENYYNKTETNSLLSDKQDKRDDIVVNLTSEKDYLFWQDTAGNLNSYKIPKVSKLSELDDDVGYMKKSEYELFKVVQELPTENIDTNVIYLVPTFTRNNNVYTEFIFANGEWEKLGEVAAKVDLSDYYTKLEVDNKLKDKAGLSYVDTELNKKTNKSYVDSELLKKSDKTYVDAELNKKANITYVDSEIANIPKPDLSSYYKKSETYSSNEIDTKLNLKANKTDVPTKFSQLNNDIKLVNESYVDKIIKSRDAINLQVEGLHFNTDSPSEWIMFLASQGVSITGDFSKIPPITVYDTMDGMLFVFELSKYSAKLYYKDFLNNRYEVEEVLNVYDAIQGLEPFQWKRIITSDDLGDINSILDDINGV